MCICYAYVLDLDRATQGLKDLIPHGCSVCGSFMRLCVVEYPKGPCTWALKGIPYHDFGAHVGIIVVLGPRGVVVLTGPEALCSFHGTEAQGVSHFSTPGSKYISILPTLGS